MSMQLRIIGGKQVGVVGFGSMRLTLPGSIPEHAFQLMKEGINLGATFWNGGEFYGANFVNLKMIAAYFEKYPEDRAKVFLSIKGGLNIQTREPLTAAQGIYESVENIQKHLGNVRMDLFQCGRVPDMPIEETMTILSKLVKQGAFDYIGLSEASADTLRRAHKIHPIAALETEYSMFTTNVERNGVLEACVELKVPLIAYSPLSRGIITDKVRTAGGFPQGDVRGQYPRMQPGNREHNMQLVERIGEIASKKGVPISQVAIAWVIAQANNIIVLPGSNNLEQITENCSSGDLLLDDSDISDIRMILNNIEIKGTRYPAALMSHVEK